jgi:hypothetical protein
VEIVQTDAGPRGMKKESPQTTMRLSSISICTTDPSATTRNAPAFAGARRMPRLPRVLATRRGS